MKVKERMYKNLTCTSFIQLKALQKSLLPSVGVQRRPNIPHLPAVEARLPSLSLLSF